MAMAALAVGAAAAMTDAPLAVGALALWRSSLAGALLNGAIPNVAKVEAKLTATMLAASELARLAASKLAKLTATLLPWTSELSRGGLSSMARGGLSSMTNVACAT